MNEADPHRALKNAFARFATGVTVAACAAPGRAPVGVTANSFASVSLEPPLVLWCLETKASVFPDFDAADAYAISVLRADQQEQSVRFATPGQHEMTPSEIETRVTGAPLLRERLAGFDCRVAARHRAGDHVILVGEVAEADYRAGAPLLYVGSRYADGADLEGEGRS